MCAMLCGNVIYINSALSIICFTRSNVLLHTNVITYSRFVFVFGLITTFVSGEPSYDESHVRDGET